MQVPSATGSWHRFCHNVIGLVATKDPEVEFVMVLLAGHSNLCKTFLTKLLILKPCGLIRISSDTLSQHIETIKLHHSFTSSRRPSCKLRASVNVKQTSHFAVCNACLVQHPGFLLQIFLRSQPDPKSDLGNVTSHPVTFVFPQRILWLEIFSACTS